MVTITGKKKPTIQKGAGFSYNPETFAKEHIISNFYEVEDPEELLKIINPFKFKGRHFIVFDTETHPYYTNSHLVPTGVVRRWVGTGKKAIPQDYPFSMQFCDGTHSYAIYDSIDNGFKKFKALRPLLEDPTIEKIAHNTKFDMHESANADLKITGRLHDTVVLAKLANENRTSFQLRDLAARLESGVVKFEYMVDAYKQMNKVSDYRQIPKELLTQYGCADVWNCYLEFITDYEKLEQDNLIELYDKECELMVALYAMERYGMPVDLTYEEPLKADLQKITDEAEKAIYDEAGKLFNINSGKQLYDVLIGLGVKSAWIPRTDKGNPQLNKATLDTLAAKYNVSIVKKILEFRKNEKLLVTYANGIYEQRDKNHTVHGSINQTEATTGRMSITKPALQTLPKKDKRIRRMFIPEKDCSLYFMDLDQIEYRLFAHYAKIPSLLEAIEKGYDVHAATAAMIFHKELEEFNKYINMPEPNKDDENYDTIKDQMNKAAEMRSKGKTINFALIYGVGIDHLSELLSCSSTEATELKSHYFSQLPEARIFIATVHQVIKERGYVRNFYGRRRRLDNNDCYKAPNSLIQGCAADYIKSKLVDIYKYMMYNNLKSYLANIVHDELVEMIYDDEKEHLPVLRWLLSDFSTFRCPITAGIETGGPSWGQKVTVSDVDFKEPADFGYLNYNVYDGKVFDIRKDRQ